MQDTTTKTKDDLIQKLIDLVTQKKKIIAEATKKPVWETNCIFKYSDGYNDSMNDGFNLNTVTDIKVLVRALAFLIRQEQSFKEANERLGVDIDFKWGNYSLTQWENDFKAKVDRIELTKTKASLEVDEASLNKLVSKERREELELAAIALKYGL